MDIRWMEKKLFPEVTGERRQEEIKQEYGEKEDLGIEQMK
jgi:hypothetical protein